ncbi:MAG: hypothetical protein HY738_19550, partial [Bacteroidia bacterium]|nr:hypothetical protein [Bacteroidia bacterium]
YLKLPDLFNGKKVEIIVLDTKDITSENIDNTDDFYNSYTVNDDYEPTVVNEPNELQKLLLKAPVWNEENFQQFKDIHKSFNQWKV